MTDFWNDSPTDISTVKKSSLPPRPKKRSVGIPILDTKRSDKTKMVATQLAELNGILAEAEAEEDKLMAKHALANRSAHAGLPYESKTTAKAQEASKTSRMSSIAELEKPSTAKPTSAPKASMPSMPSVQAIHQLTEREMLILENVAENRRLTTEMLAEYFLRLGMFPHSDIKRVSASLRVGSLARLLEKGCLKKISPPRGTTPFFILTALGMAHLDSELPLEESMLDEKFKHDSVDIFEHKEILNIASAVIQFKTGTILLEGNLKTTGNPTVYSPPAQPVITGLQIASASRAVEAGNHSDINAFQAKASESFFNLYPRSDRSPETFGLPHVRNGEFNSMDMTKEKADDYVDRMKHSFHVPTKKGEETILRKVSPAFLFSTYTDEGKPEPRPLIDFVVVQPNVIVRSSKTGEDELWSGSLAVKVELALKSPQQIQYELWAILRSTHGFAGCYIISASDVIKESYSEAWIDLIESRKIPYQLHDWLKFGKHQPLNSSTKVSVKHYSKPVNNQAAKTYING